MSLKLEGKRDYKIEGSILMAKEKSWILRKCKGIKGNSS
jgi:hypothetical protein